MAHGTLRAYQDELRSQWQADWENWQNVGQWRGFVGGGGQRLDFDSQDSAASGDGNGYNLTLVAATASTRPGAPGSPPVSTGRSWKPAPRIPTTG